MRKGLLPISALGFCLAAMPAMADVLTVPEVTMTPSVQLPAKGSTMADVEKQFGEPATKRPTVGGGSPKQPPITRWDYSGFSVIFEKDRVVDGVIPGAPPRIVNRHGLQRVDVPVIAPSVSYTPVEAAQPDAPAEMPTETPAEVMPAETPVEAMPAEMMASPSETPVEAPAETYAPPAEAPAASEPAASPEAAPPAEEPNSTAEEPQPLP